MPAALSLPPLARSGGGGGGGRAGRAGRKPRHVSAFRERILEERRVRKEVIPKICDRCVLCLQGKSGDAILGLVV